jgi:EmrB/QacA subfamily drug resistance transporter
LLLFVVIELNARDPMLDLRLFKNSVFSISVLGGSLLNMGLFGGVFLIPIFTQNLMGKTPMETGLMLMPAALVTVVMMPLSGALFDRIGPRAVTFIGLLTLTLGTWEFKNLSADTTVLHITLIASLRSLGMGLALMPMTTAGMNTIPGSLVGRASSLNNVCRQVAGSFGIAILTTIMQGRQALHLARLSDSLAVDSPAVPLFMRQVGDIWGASAGSGQGTALSLLSGLVTKQSMILAIDDTFIAAALFIGIAIPFAFFLGQGKKQQQPVLSEKLNQ